MRTNDSRYMQPIMAEIAHADPATFKRMEAADWLVTVVDGPEDLELLARENPGAAYSLASALGRANGVTVVAIHGEPVPTEIAQVYRNTWLNRPYINDEAEQHGVSPVKYAADILVHEFAHREDYADEPAAYDAGIAFARKMGEPVIAMAQTKTKAEVQRRENESEQKRDALMRLIEELDMGR